MTESVKFRVLPQPLEVLKILVDAIKALEQPGLSMGEIQRFRSVIAFAQQYHVLFKAYVKLMKLQDELPGTLQWPCPVPRGDR